MSEERKEDRAGAGATGPGNSERSDATEVDELPRRLPVVCRLLRTKVYGALDSLGHDGREGRSTTAAYWCLRTMGTWGLDDQPAHPWPCQRGRVCYEAEEQGEV